MAWEETSQQKKVTGQERANGLLAYTNMLPCNYTLGKLFFPNRNRHFSFVTCITGIKIFCIYAGRVEEVNADFMVIKKE